MTDNDTTIRVPKEWVDLENDLEELYRKAGECWELAYDSTPREDGTVQAEMDVGDATALKDALGDLELQVKEARRKVKCVETWIAANLEKNKTE